MANDAALFQNNTANSILFLKTSEMLSLSLFLAGSLGFLAVASADIFTIMAAQSGGPLDGQVINAASSAFFLGLTAPSTYCPTQAGSACPNSTSTVLAGMSALWVSVPGGQAVYVQSTGALGFTQAHSASMPPGATVGGFFNVTDTLVGYGSPDNSTSGILACPELPYYMNTTTATYQIYADTPAFNQTNCVELDGLAPTYLPSGSPFGAWQYA